MTVLDRALLGNYIDGVTVGLRVSLPNVDALTGDSGGPGQFSFDSEWTDIAQLHQVGILGQTTVTTPGGIAVPGFQANWSALGYKPFVEARLLASNVVYDDWMNGSFGCYGYIADATPNSLIIQGGNAGQTMLYVVYRIPVPSQ